MTGVEHHKTKLTRRKVIGVGPEGVDAADRTRHGGPELMRRKVIGVAGGCLIPQIRADVAYEI
jgi:hypothetical protein